MAKRPRWRMPSKWETALEEGGVMLEYERCRSGSGVLR